MGPERLVEGTIKIAMAAAAAPPPINHHFPLCQTLAEVWRFLRDGRFVFDAIPSSLLMDRVLN